MAKGKKSESVYFKILITIILNSIIIFDLVQSDLHTRFSRYELLKTSDFITRTKRDVRSRIEQKQVSFQAFGHSFQLHLKAGSRVLSDDFSVTTIDSTGKETPFHLNLEEIFHGYVISDVGSSVSAVHDEQGVWTAFLFTSFGHFYIEPLKYHHVWHKGRNAHAGVMVMYRHEDVKPLNISRKTKTNTYGTADKDDEFCQLFSFEDDDNFNSNGNLKSENDKWTQEMHDFKHYENSIASATVNDDGNEIFEIDNSDVLTTNSEDFQRLLSHKRHGLSVDDRYSGHNKYRRRLRAFPHKTSASEDKRSASSNPGLTHPSYQRSQKTQMRMKKEKRSRNGFKQSTLEKEISLVGQRTMPKRIDPIQRARYYLKKRGRMEQKQKEIQEGNDEGRHTKRRKQKLTWHGLKRSVMSDTSIGARKQRRESGADIGNVRSEVLEGDFVRSKEIRELRNRNKSKRISVFQSPDKMDIVTTTANQDRIPSDERSTNSRLRRTDSLAMHDSCDILALADYMAFKGVGMSSVNTMAKFLVLTYEGVDKIFRTTKFGRFEGIRIVVRRMMIFTSVKMTEPATRFMGENVENVPVSKLLNSLSSIDFLQNFCIAHLTTQRNFNGVLGMAAQAKSSDWSHGICSDKYRSSRNIGLSTVIDMGDKYVSFKKYTEIVTHEMGHNFGALHDRGDPRCIPSSHDGGKYIMYPRNTAVDSPNNDNFSPCSIREIEAVLKMRARFCLKPSFMLQRNLCGNGVVDFTEDCDVGFINQADPCCTQTCDFKPNAVCSRFNSPCCADNCTIAPTKQTCSYAMDNFCLQESHCLGDSADLCDLPKAKPNHSPCGYDGGQCMNGKCMSYCAIVGKQMNPPVVLNKCACDDDLTVMCRVCCVNLYGDRKCKPYGSQRYHEGTPCLKGTCQKGVCKKLARADPQGKANLFIAGKYDNERNKSDDDYQTNGKPRTTVWLFLAIGMVAVLFIMVACFVWCKRRPKVRQRMNGGLSTVSQFTSHDFRSRYSSDSRTSDTSLSIGSITMSRGDNR